MASQADLIAWRDRLERALASDVREVADSDGSRVSYRSTSEIKSALAYVEGLINAPAVRQIRFTSSKGLYR